MDKMKDNLFGLGVFLVVVVLGGAGYSLVYSPKADLDRQSKALSTANKALKGFISEEVLPTEEYVRKITAAQEEMEDIFDEAVDVFQGRCEAFHLFFSDQAQVPTVSEFSGQYQDSSTSLRTKYWEKFPRKAVEGKEGEPEKEEDPEKRAPIIEMVKEKLTTLPPGTGVLLSNDLMIQTTDAKLTDQRLYKRRLSGFERLLTIGR